MITSRFTRKVQTTILPAVRAAKITVINVRDVERLGTLPVLDQASVAANLASFASGVLGAWRIV